MRDSNGDSVNNMLERLKKAAEGAALATETRAKVTLLFSVRDVVPNDSLGKLMQKHLDRVGAPAFDDSDVNFAKAMQKELGLDQAGLSRTVMPYTQKNGGTASSDIGEVSAAVPLAELCVVARPLGTASHHWATTSCASSPIGWKGMLVAAKVLAASSVDLLSDPLIVKAAKDEFKIQTQGKPYISPLAPDAKVPAH
jgi:aminobenzoyl-glutamate utilization protein B